jgi:hypothetical protein
MARLVKRAAAAVLALAIGCSARSAPRGPEETCVAACRARAPGCDARQCGRGCNLVLDRIVEHEGDAVIACVAAGPAACDDRSFARCAARVGPHADGGPPPPPPPSDGLDDDSL